MTIYDYRRIAVTPRGWELASTEIRGPGATAVAAAGGSLYGLWNGHIGMGSTEGVVMTAWPTIEAAVRHGADVLSAAREARTVSSELLEPTVRPTDTTPPDRPGLYAHRWFSLSEADWPEFLDLSDGAWPNFEATFDARIYGFWRSLAVAAPRCRILLMTNYPSLQNWEGSRYTVPTDDPKTAATLARFKRRREIIDETIVAITQPV